MGLVVEELEFDSKLLGCRVGRVALLSSELTDWRSLVESAQLGGYRMVCVEGGVPPLAPIVDASIGASVTRIEFTKQLEKSVVSSDEVKSLASTTISPGYRDDLLTLAFLSGRYSRFYVDKRLPKEAFEQLYTTWLDRSLSGEIADETLVSNSFRPIGFLTSKFVARQEAKVGLIAVSPEVQGQGWGRRLLKAAETRAARAGCFAMRIPTQEENQAACDFYRRCGYVAERLLRQTHLWIEDK